MKAHRARWRRGKTEEYVLIDPLTTGLSVEYLCAAGIGLGTMLVLVLVQAARDALARRQDAALARHSPAARQ